MGEGSVLIEGLRRPEAYDHPVDTITVLETHISWVLLTGPVAYKIRKAVDLGFLDFTTLERRLHDCREELRLNRRLVRDLYLGLAAVVLTERGPRLQALAEEATDAAILGAGPAPVEVAVRMRQFPQEALLPAALARGEVGGEHVDDLAETLARFHAAAAIAPADGPYGTPTAVREPVEANVRCLRERAAAALQPRLERLAAWNTATFTGLVPLLRHRLEQGRVRECHGDLHLGNMLLRRGRIEVFDCLEFSPALRWIDVISDLAFLVMDLQQRGHPALGARLLNHWLECSGDYAGLGLWRWTVSYRALVRAKVAALSGDGSADGPVAAYLALAEAAITPAPQALLICHGLSGSGKSHHTRPLAAELGAIRLRSDVERKRLFGLWGIPPGPRRRGDLYGREVSTELFSERLPALAARVLAAGFPVIVDACFLRRCDRAAMAAVAARAGVPLLILEFSAPESLLRARIDQRQRSGHDPSDADLSVLERQIGWDEPLSAAELQRAIPVTPASAVDATAAAVRPRLGVAAPEPAEDARTGQGSPTP
ncbi:MAG: AAA family ATPase [Synechococcaceae cyanobacterium]